MATNLVSFRTAGTQACLPSAHDRKPDSARRKRGSANSNWWTPLFGWSTEPDYIDHLDKSPNSSDPDPDARTARSPRFTPGCFTEEKAKQLRMMTKETSFHDAMYHFAIASCLATDFKDRSHPQRLSVLD